MKFISIIFTLFFFSLLSAQKEVDSLRALLSENQTDSTLYEINTRLGKLQNLANPDEALKAYRNCLALSIKMKDSKKEAKSTAFIGESYFVKGELDSASFYYNKASSIAEEAGEEVDALRYRGLYVSKCLFKYRRLDESLKLALEIYDKYKGHENGELEYTANSILYQVYFFIEDREELMLPLAEVNMEIANELGDSMKIERSLFRLAQANSWLGFQRKSINYYLKVIEIQLKNKDNGVSKSYNNMANRYKHLGIQDSAIYYFKLAEYYSYKEGRMEGVGASKLYIGREYFTAGQFDLAIQYGLESLEKFREAKVLRRQDHVANLLYKAYKEKGDAVNALKYLEMKLSIQDSVLSRKMSQNLVSTEKNFNYQLEHRADSLAHAHEQELNKREVAEQKRRAIYLYVGLGLAVLFGIVIFNRFRISNRQKNIIQKQKEEVEEQKHIVDEKNQEILDSMIYAKRIQNAILPNTKKVKELLRDSFVMYKPKDIVAGDFYWLENLSNESRVPSAEKAQDGISELTKNKLSTRHPAPGTILLAAADCTGHGVPGAMVSVVCNNGLNRSVKEFGLSDPGKILDKTRELVIQEFEKSEEDVKDGMDIALVSLSLRSASDSRGAGSSSELKYAGAHNPLWIIRKGAEEVEEIKANKQPIGKFSHPEPYNTHHVDLNEGDVFYLFSDGFADQFGGPKGKKFKLANFKQLLLTVQDQDMEQQKQSIDKAFEEWRGDNEQLDDVCVIGVRV